MSTATNFNLTQDQRRELLNHLFNRLDDYYENTSDVRITPPLDQEEIIGQVEKADFSNPSDPEEALNHVVDSMKKYAVHTPHPKYFGLYNPRTNFAGILADFTTALFNPQLAAWSHSPFAVEVENFLIREFGKKFGFEAEGIDGVFTTGGAEANQTAVLCAINFAFDRFSKDGLFGLDKQPVIYCSSEAHHSVDKAARTSGLGYNAVRHIPVTDDLKMDIGLLKSAIQEDMEQGFQPFMIVGTAGITGTGVIEDLPALRTIADTYNCWFHADGAYGGAAILNKDLKGYLKGIESADSITFDAHKWMSLPMGTSLFITSHPHILTKTFGTHTEYMPKETKDTDVVDPYTHSIQWSRRFNGLKLYLSMLFFGWEGYDEVIGYQAEIGAYLKEQLIEHGWSVKNETPLPVVCFTDPEFEKDEDFAGTVSQNIIKAGTSWISVYPVQGLSTIRACVINYSTTCEDIDALVSELNKEREQYAQLA